GADGVRRRRVRLYSSDPNFHGAFVADESFVHNKSDLPHQALRCSIRDGNLGKHLFNQAGGERFFDKQPYSFGPVASLTTHRRYAVAYLDSLISRCRLERTG